MHDKSDHLQKSRRSAADPLLSGYELCLCGQEQHHAPDISDVLLAVHIEVGCVLLLRAGKAVHQTALEQRQVNCIDDAVKVHIACEHILIRDCQCDAVDRRCIALIVVQLNRVLARLQLDGDILRRDACPVALVCVSYRV